jgi:hypothetical protein
MNLDIKYSVCIHVVYILQYPTSGPTSRSTQHTMVNFHPFQQANMANQQTTPHVDVIKQMMPGAASRPKESEH